MSRSLIRNGLNFQITHGIITVLLYIYYTTRDTLTRIHNPRLIKFYDSVKRQTIIFHRGSHYLYAIHLNYNNIQNTKGISILEIDMIFLWICLRNFMMIRQRS